LAAAFIILGRDTIILNAAEAQPPIKRWRPDKTAREAPCTQEEHLQSAREEYERLKAKSEPGS